MQKGQEFTREEVTQDETRLTAKMDVDPELRAAITDPEGGLLTAGALPALNIASTAGNKTLLSAIDKAFPLKNWRLIIIFFSCVCIAKERGCS